MFIVVEDLQLTKVLMSSVRVNKARSNMSILLPCGICLAISLTDFTKDSISSCPVRNTRISCLLTRERISIQSSFKKCVTRSLLIAIKGRNLSQTTLLVFSHFITAISHDCKKNESTCIYMLIHNTHDTTQCSNP